MGATGAACTDDTKVKANATATILNMVSSYHCNELFFYDGIILREVIEVELD